MQFINLADRPEFVPLIAEWYFSEWGKNRPERTLQTTLASIRDQMCRDRIPLHLIAMKKDDLLGVAQLRFHEMEIYPEKEHWLGGVYINPEFRGKGLATILVRKMIELAESFQVETLYLQTVKLDGGIYSKLGWIPEERVTYRGVDVLVMQKKVFIKNR